MSIYVQNYKEFVNESKKDEKEQMSEAKIREAIAESGKTSITDMMKYLKSRYEGKYDVKLAKKNARELAAEIKNQ